jgi:ribosome-associated protein
MPGPKKATSSKSVSKVANEGVPCSPVKSSSAKKPAAMKVSKSPAAQTESKVTKAGKVAKAPRVGKAVSTTVKKPRVPKAPKTVDPEEALVRLCADAALDKKALDPVILDMRGLSSFTDFFLIVTGTSEPQLKAIAASIREKVREKLGLRPHAEDGFPVSQWVVIDYGSVIIHVFHSEKRAIYGLEYLWGDAPRIEVVDPSKR